MDNQALIAAATAAAMAALKGVEAANNGDPDAAKAFIAQAQSHFDSFDAAWEAAAQPGET